VSPPFPWVKHLASGKAHIEGWGPHLQLNHHSKRTPLSEFIQNVEDQKEEQLAEQELEHAQKRIKGAFDPLSKYLLESALEDRDKLSQHMRIVFERMDINSDGALTFNEMRTRLPHTIPGSPIMYM
jgi:hypothetical protein